MKTKALNDAIKRAQNWPAERQEEAARMLRDMEAQDYARYRLTAEQADEVERRLANVDPQVMTFAEVRARLRRPGA